MHISLGRARTSAPAHRIRLPGRHFARLFGILILACVLAAAALGIQYLSQAQPQIIPPYVPEPYLPRTVPAILNAGDIQLAASSTAIQGANASFLADSINARAYASFYQDISYLFPYYSGQALQALQQKLLSITQSGYIQYHVMDPSRSYYPALRSSTDSTAIEVDACEYWQVYYYDPDTEVQVPGGSGWQLIPQTLTIETVDGAQKITAIRTYDGRAFCASRILPDGK